MKHISKVSKAQVAAIDEIIDIIETAIADITAAIEDCLKKEEAPAE